MSISNKLEDLSRLGTLLDEGRVTQSEYEALKHEILGPLAEEPEPTTRESEGIEEPELTTLRSEAKAAAWREYLGEDEATEGPSRSSAGLPPAMGSSSTPKTPGLYRWSLGLAIATVFLGSTFGLLSWMTILLGAFTLVEYRDVSEGRWMAWSAVIVGPIYALMNAYLNGHFDGLL